MNDNNLEILQTLINKTSELYDLYIELSKLDNEKGTSKQLDVINDIHLKIEEIDDILKPLENNHEFINEAKDILKQINSMVTIEDIFSTFQSKNNLVIKRLYNTLIKLEINNKETLANNLTGYFKEKANEKTEYSAYLFEVLPNYNLELSIRSIELLEQTDLKHIKYILAFFNETLDFILSENYYESVNHSFDQNTMVNTTYYIHEEMKEEFKNVFGINLLKKDLQLLSKVKNEKLINYLKIVLRSSALFINNKVLNNLISSLKLKDNDNIKYLLKYHKKDQELANKFETEISKGTLKIINRLFEITSTIKDTYDSLLSLEKDGYKSTKQYNSMLAYLQLTIEEEKILYDYFNVVPEEAISASKYLDEIIYKKDYCYENTAVALKDDENELIALRISQKLDKIALNNDEYFHDSIDEDDEIICSSEDDFTFIKNKMRVYNETYYYEIFTFFQELIDDKSLYFKYNLAFLNNLLEQNLITSGLDNIPHNFNINSNMPNVSFEFISQVNNAYALDKLSLFIEDIVEYDDKTIFDSDDDEEDNELLEENLEELASFLEANNVDNENEEPEENEEQEDFEDLFYYNLLLAKLKTCLLFADDKGIELINNKILKIKSLYEKNNHLVFKQIFDIINNAKDLKKNIDMKSKNL